MRRHIHDPYPEYPGLVQHIEEFAADHGREDAIRTVADGLEDLLREQFKSRYEVDRTTDGENCIGRLTAGWNQCQHQLPQKEDASGTPPHHPPCADHADLWLRDGDAVVFTMHLYDVNRDQLREIVDFADKWGLEVGIEPGSWYFSNRSVHIVFYTPEWLKESTAN